MSPIVLIIVIVVALPVLGLMFESLAMIWDKRRFVPSGKLIDVGGHRLHMDVQGEAQGKPTIICESGGGSFGIEWKLVQNELSKVTRVVVYDRAGNGWSDKGTHPRTSQRIAEELHTLLKNTQIEPPYILVGQSFGVINIRKFQELYPDEVVGMVFIDGSNPKQIDKPDFDPDKQLRRLFIPLLVRRFGLLRLMSKRVFWQHRKLPSEYQRAYVALALASSDIVKTELEAYFHYRPNLPDSVGDIPIVVLTRSALDLGDGKMTEADQEWMAYQQDLLTLSPNSKHIVAEKGGRYLHVDEPDLVIGAIKDVMGVV